MKSQETPYARLCPFVVFILPAPGWKSPEVRERRPHRFSVFYAYLAAIHRSMGQYVPIRGIRAGEATLREATIE
jgi:hypothetical protein